MKLLVFLGNIGGKYEKTRHNVGFLFGDYLQKKWGFSAWKEMPKFFGTISEGQKNEKKILFLKPSTFMNLSGKSIVSVVNFYKIKTTDILMCSDDKDIPFGTVRFREKGSSGGHNGVADSLRALGTEEIFRIKIGVDTAQRSIFESTADFVLGEFQKEEIEELENIFQRAEEKLEKVFC